MVSVYVDEHDAANKALPAEIQAMTRLDEHFGTFIAGHSAR